MLVIRERYEAVWGQQGMVRVAGPGLMGDTLRCTHVHGRGGIWLHALEETGATW